MQVFFAPASSKDFATKRLSCSYAFWMKFLSSVKELEMLESGQNNLTPNMTSRLEAD